MRSSVLPTVLLLASCFGCGAVPAPKPRPAAPPSQPLVAGQAVARSLAEGEVHRYRVRLAASQVLLLTVDQRGVDLVVSSFDPAGHKLGEIDSPTGPRGPESVVVEAEEPGDYLIELRPFIVPLEQAGIAVGAEPGAGYEVRVDGILSRVAYVERQLARTIVSPRILALWKAILARQPGAADRFWAGLQAKAPLVEPYPNDDRSALVTFVFRTEAPYAALLHGPTGQEQPMTRIADSNLWFLSARFPRDARADYAFLGADGPLPFHLPFSKDGGGPWRERWQQKSLDPNNPQLRDDMSRFELPAARPSPWLAEGGSPAGKLVQRELQSSQLQEKRRIGVYTPPGYDGAASYPLIIALDGEANGLDANVIPLPRILDNLIAAQQIPPVVAVLVANQGTRDRDLTASAPFSDFLALELLPILQAEYRAGLTPAATLVAGASYGGLCAAYTALRHADRVGLVLSQSGAFWWLPGESAHDLPRSVDRGWLPRQFATSPRAALRFYLNVGLFESDARHDFLEMNRRMRDVLEAKGYPVSYAEFSGGHDYEAWRDAFADGLIALLGKPR